MSLLNKLIKEMAAGGSTGAGSVAGFRSSLFGGGVIDLKKEQRRQRRLMRRVMNYKVIGESLGVSTGENRFDPADVISKIDAAEKRAKTNKDTVTFGLEDEDGNLVKVYVKSDQAEDFEHELASLLAGEDDNEDDENSAMEIAEVLFKLKDKFEIVDVEWPEIEGDEEEEQEVDTADDSGEGDMTADTQAPEGEMADGSADDLEVGDESTVPGSEESGDEEAAKSALQQVIDMMKADAKAKEAEANAKEAEAKAKEAEYVAQASASKVKQEEEVLDMEAYYKDKSEKEKEAKQLAKLAKYKHDKAKDAEAGLSFESAEIETDDDDDEITLDELSELIIKNLRAN